MKRAIIIIILSAGAIGSAYFLFNGNNNPESTIGNVDVQEEKIVPEKPTEIIFFGDMMLDRRVFSLTAESGSWEYPFTGVDDLLSGSSANIANLEGPVTSNLSESVKANGMRFTINENFVPELSKRFAALGLANNHTLDFGEEGLRETKKYLSAGDISFFGDYFNRGDNTSVVIRVNGKKIGLAGYHALSGKNMENVVIDIQKMKQVCDLVIALPHWGEEYEFIPSNSQVVDAHTLADAGADMVIGGHPHVIQPIEIYGRKPIFYSLGNFIFDQYFSEEVMEGLAIRVTIKEEGPIEYELIPLINDRLSRVRPMNRDEAAKVIKKITEASDMPETEKESLGLFRSFSL
jgi:poly-gamma-glutamate synthesis protein (capsule biosynthesis protein)